MYYQVSVLGIRHIFYQYKTFKKLNFFKRNLLGTENENYTVKVNNF